MIEFRYLTPDDLPELLYLQSSILTWLDDKTLFRPVAAERHRSFLESRGCSAGAFVDGRLIAYGAAQFHVPAGENQGRAIGVADEDLYRVCHLEGTVVSPAYAGLNLARALTRMRLIRALSEGCPIVIATISPFNAPSLHSFVPTGFLVKGLREGAGSLLRFYVSLDLRSVPVALDDEVTTIPTSDLEAQKTALAAGLWGFRPMIGASGLAMQYARFELQHSDPADCLRAFDGSADG